MQQQQSKFLACRRRLSDLQYTETFGADAVDLIDHLVTDLVATTKAYKQVQDREAKLASDLSLAQAQLFPLRKENARLARETHKLHIDSISQTEEAKHLRDDQNRTIRNLEEDIRELKLLSKVKDDQIRSKDQAFERLREAYENSTDPALKGVSSASGRAIKMSVQAGPASSSPGKTLNGNRQSYNQNVSNSSSNNNGGESAIVDSLRHQLTLAQRSAEAAEAEVKRLHATVAAREHELSRGTKMAISSGNDGGSSSSDGIDGAFFVSGAAGGGGRMEQLEAADVANKRIIDQLNGQVDFLNEQLALREAQLVESADKVREFDGVQTDLKVKTQKLEQSRKEHSQLSAIVRALEQKLMHQHQQHQHSPNSTQQQSIANKGASSSNSSNNNIDHNGISDHPEHKEETLPHNDSDPTNTALLLKLMNEREQMTEAMAVMSTQLAEAQQQTAESKLSSPSTKRISSGNSSTSTSKSSTTNATSSRTAPPSAPPVRGGMGGSKSTVGSNAGRGMSKDSRSPNGTKNSSSNDALVIDLNAEIETLNRNKAFLSRSLVQSEERYGVLEGEVKRLNEQLVVLRSAGDGSQQSLMEAAESSRQQAAALRVQLSESERDRSALKALNEQLSAHLAQERAAAGTAKVSLEESDMKLLAARGDVARLEERVHKVEGQLSSNATNQSELRLQLAEVTSQLQVEQQRSARFQAIAHETQQQLDARLLQLAESTQRLAVLSSSSFSAGEGEGEGKAELRQEEVTRLRVSVDQLQHANAELLKERALLEQAARALGVKQKQSEEVVSTVVSSASLMDAILQKDATIARLEERVATATKEVQQLAQLRRDEQVAATSVQAQLEQEQDRSADLDAQCSQLNSELRLLQQRYKALQQDFEQCSEQQQSTGSAGRAASQQVTVLRNELSHKNQLLASSERDLSGAMQQLEELTSQLEQQRRGALKQLAEHRQLVMEHSEQAGRIEELKLLIGNLEAQSRSAEHQQNRVVQQLQRSEKQVAQLEADREMTEQRLREKDSQLKQQKEALAALDAERDDLQEQLDNEEGRNSSSQQQQIRIEQQMQVLRQQNAQLEQKLRATAQELAVAHKQVLQAEARLNATQSEAHQLRQRVESARLQQGGAAEDLTLMTRENQALTSELAAVSTDKERLRSRLSEVEQKLGVAEQRLRAADIEQADLLATYRSVVQEKRRMETDLGSLSTEKVKEGASQQQLREQLEQARSSLSAHSQMEARWTAERLALRAQTEALNERLVRLQEKLETVEADNRRMLQDTFGLQQTNAMLNERVQLVIRRATAATDANKVLTARLSGAEREREAVRALVQIERQRAAEMGTVAEEARTLAATKEMQLQRFRSSSVPVSGGDGGSQSSRSSNDTSSSRSSGSSNNNSTIMTAAAAATATSDATSTEHLHQN